jgi:hypothetical protein
MFQHEIDLAVARATGESLTEIERLGFTLADPAIVEFDPESHLRPPLVIDWDAHCELGH